VALNIGMVGRFRDAAPQALAQAIRDVVARHETLRTRIHVRGEALELSLHDAAAFQIEQENLSALEADAALAAATAGARDHCALLNPIQGGWLGRAKVFALPGGEAVAALSFNHIVADAGSRNIILDEIRDALEGKSVAAPAIAYNDFSLAERDCLDGPAGQTLIRYWRDWYDARPPLLSPQEKTPLLWGTGPRMVNNFVIPRRVMAAARDLAAQLRVTPFAVHLTLYCLALARWSRSADFTLRMLGDKRGALELSNIVGLMFCADAMDVHAPEGAPFETVLRGLIREYDAALALRLPSLHFYPPQAVRPGIVPPGTRVKIPAVFNYYAAGTQREKAEGEAMPDATAAMAWPPQVQRLPPALWNARPSAPVFLHLMDMGGRADASLHFFAGVVSEAEQQAFLETFFQVYGEVLPA
jgi:hypothetical protein